jgi:hypothetical protein
MWKICNEEQNTANDIIKMKIRVPSQLLIATSYNPVLDSTETEITDEVTQVRMLSLGIFESSDTRNENNLN